MRRLHEGGRNYLKTLTPSAKVDKWEGYWLGVMDCLKTGARHQCLFSGRGDICYSVSQGGVRSLSVAILAGVSSVLIAK